MRKPILCAIITGISDKQHRDKSCPPSSPVYIDYRWFPFVKYSHTYETVTRRWLPLLVSFKQTERIASFKASEIIPIHLFRKIPYANKACLYYMTLRTHHILNRRRRRKSGGKLGLSLTGLKNYFTMFNSDKWYLTERFIASLPRSKTTETQEMLMLVFNV